MNTRIALPPAEKAAAAIGISHLALTPSNPSFKMEALRFRKIKRLQSKIYDPHPAIYVDPQPALHRNRRNLERGDLEKAASWEASNDSGTNIQLVKKPYS